MSEGQENTTGSSSANSTNTPEIAVPSDILSFWQGGPLTKQAKLSKTQEQSKANSRVQLPSFFICPLGCSFTQQQHEQIVPYRFSSMSSYCMDVAADGA
ncbi:hypothetical protein NL676_000054 [Syzygium grande]|nr:hypothetical protein NL676_000054 [Syzygium grande]